MARKKRLTKIHYQILDTLKKHPEGISINEIRHYLIETGQIQPEEHQHLDRRLRGLYPYYEIIKKQKGNTVLYILEKELEAPLDNQPIDKTTRARILHRDGSKCQMCGRNPRDHNVVLHIDHRVPREWGGKTEDDNLWTLCDECNEGKKNFFETITDPYVREAMLQDSIHARIGTLLVFYKENIGKPVPKELLSIVAYTHDDWEKRLRELRELGWEYTYHKQKTDDGRIKVSFELLKSTPLPPNPAEAIRAAEKAKKMRKKTSKK